MKEDTVFPNLEYGLGGRTLRMVTKTVSWDDRKVNKPKEIKEIKRK